jgi:hypothetical protein
VDEEFRSQMTPEDRAAVEAIDAHVFGDAS